MKKRILVIGPTNCGKTTLINEIEASTRPIVPTLDTIYGKLTIEIPGAYIENAWMTKHIITIAQNQGRHIFLLVDQSRREEHYSPGFAALFPFPVTGVITKTDIFPENREFCTQQLEKIGVLPPYMTTRQDDLQTFQKLSVFYL